MFSEESSIFFEGSLAPAIGCRDLVSGTVQCFASLPEHADLCPDRHDMTLARQLYGTSHIWIIRHQRFEHLDMSQRAPWPYTLAAHSPSHRVRPSICSGGILLEWNREETPSPGCSFRKNLSPCVEQQSVMKRFETSISVRSWRPCMPAEHDESNFIMFVDENATADWIALATR